MKKNFFRIAELILLVAIVVVLIIGQFGDGDEQPNFPSDDISSLVQWTLEEGGNGHWYGVIAKELHWDQARALAASLKFEDRRGYLATSTSWAENEFIRSRVIASTHQPSIIDAFWLGGHFVDDRWQWINSEPLTDQFWSFGEPNNLKVETALSIWGPNNFGDLAISGWWNNLLPNSEVNRLHRIWSVIEWGEPPAVTEGQKIDTLINLTQWPSAEGGNDHWYGILALDEYYDQALRSAQRLAHAGYQGHLATIKTSEENSFILDQVIGNYRQPNLNDEYWLGGEYKDSSWSWLDSEPMDYFNWAPGEPNNLGIETAVTIWGPYCSGKKRIPGSWNNALPDSIVNRYSHFYSIVEFGPGP